jgi:hypothetical protein
MTIEMLTVAQFQELAPKVDANQNAMRSIPSGLPSAEFRARLPFPDVGNDEYGKVEQYRLRQEKPDRFVAYLSSDGRRVTTWNGETLGHVMGTIRRERWRENVRFSFRMNGRDYYAQGGGHGMCCGCKAYKQQGK